MLREVRRPTGHACVVFLAAACRIADVSLEGHPCPCVDETWVCASTSKLCVRGQVALSGFEAAWTTPNTIGWSWKAEHLDRLSAYELVVGTSRDAVERRTGDARVWTAKENPELAFASLPRSGVGDPVLSTLTDEHEPNTTYFGKLVAIDDKGVPSSTTVATASTTPAAANRIDVFADALPPSALTIPDTVTVACDSASAFAGSRCHLSYMGECDAAMGGSGTCIENLRIFGIDLSLAPIRANDFDRLAFVEFAMAVDPPAQSFWSHVWLAFDEFDDACETCWAYDPWTPRADGRYRRVQLPLRAFHGLHRPEVPFTRSATEGRRLSQFAIGGTFVRGTRVRIDEISIRW